MGKNLGYNAAYVELNFIHCCSFPILSLSWSENHSKSIKFSNIFQTFGKLMFSNLIFIFVFIGFFNIFLNEKKLNETQIQKD